MAPKKSHAPAKPQATYQSYQVQQGYVVQPAQVLAPVVIACKSGGCPYGPAPGSDYCSNRELFFHIVLPAGLLTRRAVGLR